MSLRAFHFVFIVASLILSFWFGKWCLNEYALSQEGYLMFLGVGSFVSGFGLSAYLFWFAKKTRALVALYFLLAPSLAEACAVCYADPDSVMAKSTNAGVLFLLVVISLLLVCFAGIFIYWAIRDHKQNQFVSPA